MQASLCTRCGKNPAVVFITKIEAGQTKSEGLCLKCARELHIKPVDDIMSRMGISDEDLDAISGEMMNALNGVEELTGVDQDDSDGDDDGKTATFPFLGKIFDAIRPDSGPKQNAQEGADQPRSPERPGNGRGPQPSPKGGKHRFRTADRKTIPA